MHSISPCCSTCMDSCCCPIVDKMAMYIVMPKIKPGSKVIIKQQQINKEPKIQVIRSEISNNLNTAPKSSITSSDMQQKQFLTDNSSIPNVKFYPINQNKNNNKSNIESNTSKKRNIGFAFNYESPIPNVKFTPLVNNPPHPHSPDSEFHNINKNFQNSKPNNLNTISNDNIYVNIINNNSNSSQTNPILPTRTAPSVPPTNKNIKSGANVNDSTVDAQKKALVKDLASKFEKR